MFRLKTFETFIPKKLAGREEVKKQLDAKKEAENAQDLKLLKDLLPFFYDFFQQPEELNASIQQNKDEPWALSFHDKKILTQRFKNSRIVETIVVHWNVIDRHTLAADVYKDIRSGSKRYVYPQDVNSQEVLKQALNSFPKGWTRIW